MPSNWQQDQPQEATPRRTNIQETTQEENQTESAITQPGEDDFYIYLNVFLFFFTFFVIKNYNKLSCSPCELFWTVKDFAFML